MMPGDHWRFRNDLSPQGDDQAFHPSAGAQKGVPVNFDQAFTQLPAPVSEVLVPPSESPAK